MSDQPGRKRGLDKYRGRKIRVVTAVVRSDQGYLISQRPETAVLGGLWEFPGGRVPAGEDDREVLANKLRASWGIEATIGALNMEVLHHYEEYVVHMAVYDAQLDAGPDKNAERIRFVPPGELDRYEFPGADQETIELLLSSMDQDS